MTDRIQLVLYVRRSDAADRVISTVLELCREHGRCDVNVIDVDYAPEAAEADDILVTPTLMRVAPAPTMRIICDADDLDGIRRLMAL